MLILFKKLKYHHAQLILQKDILFQVNIKYFKKIYSNYKQLSKFFVLLKIIYEDLQDILRINFKIQIQNYLNLLNDHNFIYLQEILIKISKLKLNFQKENNNIYRRYFLKISYLTKIFMDQYLLYKTKVQIYNFHYLIIIILFLKQFFIFFFKLKFVFFYHYFFYFL